MIHRLRIASLAVVCLAFAFSTGCRDNPVGSETPVVEAASNHARYAGVYGYERSSGSTSEKVTLTLRANGTYHKLLEAVYNGQTFGGGHEGTWTTDSTTVFLSGNSKWPAFNHSFSEFQRIR